MSYFLILALVFAFALGLIFVLVRKHKIPSHKRIGRYLLVLGGSEGLVHF